MTAREFVERLEARGAKSRRNREDDYHVQCPAHDDRTPSLHVSDRDGRVLLSCQAGCETRAVLDAAELDWPDLFHDSRNGAREIVDTYDYTDPDGRLAFQTVRYWPKDFRQRQPDGAGGWIWSINEPRCVRWLYRSTRVLEALERGEPIFIAEGEKDVDALEQLGLYATTNPMGAGKWRDEHARMLIGAADVNVIRDRDEEGRKHAAAVVASLRRVGVEPTLLEPRSGKDVSEHLAARHSWMALVEIDAGALVAADESPPIQPESEQRPAILDELLFDMQAAVEHADDPLPYVIDPIAVQGVLTALVAKHSAFKSFLMMVLGYRCHAGLGEIAGLPCAPVTALYVDAENGAKLMGRRFKSSGIPADGLLVADGARLRLPKDVGKLRALIKATGAKLVILDALRRLTPGLSEDSSQDMTPVMAALANLARELDVAIVLLHHQSSKPGAPPSRGSSAIEDQADVAFRMTRYPGNRLKLWPLNGKFRIDAEPPPLWLDFAYRNGVFALGACDPISEGEDEDDGPSADEQLAQRIDALAEQVRQDDGWPPKRLAAAAGSSPDSGSFHRALTLLFVRGTWEAVGATKSRRIRPVKPDQMEIGEDE
jgi:hypothetical protein